MKSRPTALLVLVVALTVTVAVPIGAGAFTPPPQQTPQVGQTDDQTQPQTNQTNGNQTTGASFTIDSISAPTSVAPDSTATVVAFISNPNSETDAQPVEFRLEGDVVDRKRVVIPGDSVEPVTFTLDTTGLGPGEQLTSIFTENAGQNARITVSQSFTVSDLSAPESARAGESVTATATVSNPNDFATTQTVTFRFGGAPLVTKQVTLNASESTEFTAEADTSGLSPGTYAHGVLTRDAGELAFIDVAEPMSPAVTFDDQETDGTTVTVDSVTLPDGGYVVIHDERLVGEENVTDNASTGDPVGSVIGTSGYLEAGTTENVTIQLFDVPGTTFTNTSLTADQSLFAMAHRETTGDRTLDFVRSDGENDGAYTIDGTPVTDEAAVTVIMLPPDNGTATPGDNGTATPEMPSDNETATPGDNGTATPTGDDTATPAEDGTETPSDETQPPTPTATAEE